LIRERPQGEVLVKVIRHEAYNRLYAVRGHRQTNIC
jgi:hypothetical protein